MKSTESSRGVIGLDWTIDMADTCRRLGADKSVQVKSHRAVFQGR